MSNGTGGPVLYRLQRRTSSENKLDIWVQFRRWLRWHTAYHVDNERRKAVIDVIETLEKLQDALERVKLHTNDQQEADIKIRKDVSQRPDKMFFASGGNVSNTFRGKRITAEEELPDRTEQYKSLVKTYDLERLVGKPAKKGPAGKTTGYYLEGQLPADVDWSGEGVDLTHGWKLNQSRSRSKNKSNQNQQNQSRS